MTTFSYSEEEYQALPNNIDKTCNTCRWHSLTDARGKPVLLPELAVCTNPKQGVNVVSGEPRIDPCWTHRNTRSLRAKCNGRAHWWEAKETTDAKEN